MIGRNCCSPNCCSSSSFEYTANPAFVFDHHSKCVIECNCFCKHAGFYMYIEASDVKEGDKARLETNRITARSNACLSFWYHMFGSHMGYLRVKMVTDRLEEVIWSRNGKLTRVVNLSKIF